MKICGIFKIAIAFIAKQGKIPIYCLLMLEIKQFLLNLGESDINMNRYIFFGLLALFCFFSSSAKASFVEGLEDIPLADGLLQSENGLLNFGNEETRLVEVYLTSETTDFKSVATFYKNTLPQMGWRLKASQKEKLSFTRDGESLEISKESANPFVVRLVVKSKN